jgi:hypothetical protein
MIAGLRVLVVFSFSLSRVRTVLEFVLRAEKAVFAAGNIVMFPSPA